MAISKSLQNAPRAEPRPATNDKSRPQSATVDVADKRDDDAKPWPPLYGLLEGKIWIDPDYDFTQPTFLDWGREDDER